MKKIENIEELKSIQLNILLKVHRFCVDNNIKYSLADGTLLGAVRHKGYIPWDDDIDICMERKDYHRFLCQFPSIYQNEISVISMERDARWAYPFAKAYDVRTIMKESTSNNKPEIGISIDVFPLDEVPDDNSVWSKYNKMRRTLIMFFRIKSLCWRNGRSTYKNFFMLVMKIILFFFSYRWLSVTISNYGKKNNDKGYSRLFECCLGMILKKPFPKSAFEETIEMSFEGYLVKVMKGYHECLENSYGAYMQLPPEEKRVSHHIFEAYWK